MWKKIAVGGAAVAAIVGAGTASMALSGSDDPGGPGGRGEGLVRDVGHGPRPGLARLGHMLHGQWVTKNKAGDLVTHDEIHGKVTAVSATSISVKAEDGVTQTYVINADTKVREVTKGKPRGGEKSDISKVASGDNVVVLGTGTTTLTAKRVIDIQDS